MSSHRAHLSPAHQRGQGTIEYTIVVMLVALVVVARPDLITQMLTAIRDFYNAFVFSISMSTFLW